MKKENEILRNASNKEKNDAIDMLQKRLELKEEQWRKRQEACEKKVYIVEQSLSAKTKQLTDYMQRNY